MLDTLNLIENSIKIGLVNRAETKKLVSRRVITQPKLRKNIADLAQKAVKKLVVGLNSKYKTAFVVDSAAVSAPIIAEFLPDSTTELALPVFLQVTIRDVSAHALVDTVVGPTSTEDDLAPKIAPNTFTFIKVVAMLAHLSDDRKEIVNLKVIDHE
nr:MAG TPA: hypothetical protein [Caudoviricetes sp.]